ncbi:hypothetical protein PG984_008222 [Apiospora sp. TS-2023a]
MFLHSGASLHGHEYSNKSSQPAGQAGARRNHLLRSTFTSPVNRPATISNNRNSDSAFPPPPRPLSVASTAAGAPASSILRVNGRPIARRAPSTPEPVVRFQEPGADRPLAVNRTSTISYKTDSPFPPPLPPRPISSAASNTTATTSPPSLIYNSKGKPLLSRGVSGTPEPAVRSHDPAAAEHGLRTVSRDETMSGDEGSVYISDSETSRAGSSVRRAQKLSSRRSTTYLLAQPAPKLNQRLLHIRPQLLLQTQQISADRRPKPTIDVYPSSAIAHSALVTPLLKRFPRLARIKRELSVGDIMLVQSEDLSAPAREPLDEDDEDSINKRDLVAILSPLGRDMAEIVLSDGTVWTAKPRIQGSNVSYDFTTEDEFGRVTTARWARRRGTTTGKTGGAATAPTSPTSSFSIAPEHRFTFSMIDPACRRHPIMATLKPNQLEVQDTYTTVSQSAGRYPPTSSVLGSPTLGSEDSDAPRSERTVQPVEDWQKTLIQVTALWVVLHQGWVASFRPMNIKCLAAASSASGEKNSSSKSSQQTRSFSFGNSNKDSNGQGQTTRSNPLHRITRRVGTGGGGQCCEKKDSKTDDVLAALPRRATSTGAAYMQKRNAQNNRLSMESPSSEDSGELLRRGPSPFSGGPGPGAGAGDWNRSSELRQQQQQQQQTTPSPNSSQVGRPKRPAFSHDYTSYPPPPGGSGSGKAESGSCTPTLAPEPLPGAHHRRVVSEYYYSSPWRVSSPLGLDEETLQERGNPFETAHVVNSTSSGGFKQPVVVSSSSNNNTSRAVDGGDGGCGAELRQRQPKRRSMLNWFTRLRGQ